MIDGLSVVCLSIATDARARGPARLSLSKLPGVDPGREQGSSLVTGRRPPPTFAPFAERGDGPRDEAARCRPAHLKKLGQNRNPSGRKPLYSLVASVRPTSQTRTR